MIGGKKGQMTGVAGAQPAGMVTRSASLLPTLLVSIFLLLLHYWDWVNQYRTDWYIIYPLYIFVSVVVAVIAHFSMQSENPLSVFRYIGKYLIAFGLLGIFIPRAFVWALNREFLNPVIANFAFFLLFILPLAFFYVIFNGDFAFANGIRTIASWWIVIVLLGLFISFIGSVTIPLPSSFEGADTQQAFDNSWERVKNGLLTFKDNIATGIERGQRAVDPYYYIGQVEQNKDKPLGVVLTELQPIDPTFYSPTQPIISGIIEAKTFLDRPLFVEPNCYINKKSNDITYAPAVPDPHQMEIFGGFGELFECEFTETFDPGVYPVDVTASFDFETWADVTYDFVHEEKVRTFQQLQRDIYQELDIEKIPTSVYTGGPVALGMSGASSRQPIVVTNEEPFLKNAHLGFTIESRWPQGRINQVHAIELLIPEQFTLFDCDRKDLPDSDVLGSGNREVPDAPGYRSYVFQNAIDTASPFTSIRCGLGLTNADALAELASLDKVSRTFILKTNYSYTVTGRTEFVVN